MVLLSRRSLLITEHSVFYSGKIILVFLVFEDRSVGAPVSLVWMLGFGSQSDALLMSSLKAGQRGSHWSERGCRS
jgi:hypothetical protein